ncbi:coiled-coil domain-containing protein [Mucisphaera calidilacus]|uniref:Uncharacterized protein n=1 Tax=Mucisphaera calidilacus TaxID=2527982 RepID=A0A518C0Y5_9BACT|nr:hypothetical protein [Mucisphaera calidilacus]QDU72870.1 hypothetical protein Pan265_27460 [Mucisphaera calidilacus]
MTHDTLNHIRALHAQATRAAVAIHALRAATCTAATLLILAAIDFVLRLPAPLRLIITLTLLVLAFRALYRLAAPRNWKTPLVRFALAIEKQRPQLHGRLASAVELAQTTPPEHEATSPAAAALHADALRQLNQLPVRDLTAGIINPRPLRQWAAITATLALVWASFALVAPGFAAAAAGRWVLPWAAGPWPTLVTLNVIDARTVRPLRSPLHIAVETPNSSADRRVLLQAHWHVGDHTFETHDQVVMNHAANDPDAPARFEAWLQPPAELIRHLETATAGTAHATVFLESGWDTYPPVSIPLAPRPRITSTTATITPPDYARPPLEPNTETLNLDQADATLTSIPGSTIDISLKLSRTINPQFTTITAAGDTDDTLTLNTTLTDNTIQLTLSQPHEPLTLTVNARSNDGLSLPRPPSISLEPRPDRQPTVRLLRPAADERVLPNAVVSLHATAADDIAVADIALMATLGDNTLPITDNKGPAPTLELTIDWPLETLGLTPGDTLTVTAAANDTYRLHGETHPTAYSTGRTIIIVDEQQLARQLQQDINLIDRRIARALAEQRRLQAEDLDTATPGQQRLAERLAELAEDARQLRNRAERNRLSDEALNQLMDQLAEGLDNAARAADRAHEQLEQAENETDSNAQQGREAQAETAAQLQALREQLDDTSAAMQAVEDARAIARRQQELADQSARLLPQTLGRRPEDLPDDLRQQLEQLKAQQDALAEQTQRAADQWREQARQLANESDSQRAQDLAEALRQAAEALEAGQIPQQMNQASAQVQGNRLANANAQQQQIARQLQQIAEQLEQNTTDSQQQQDLLAAIVDELNRLLEEQTILRDNTSLADERELSGLVTPQRTLRLQTLAALEQVEQLANQPAAESGVRDATVSQATAVTALRNSRQTPGLEAQTAAAEALRSAIETLQQQLRQDLAESVERQRRELQKAYRALAQQQRELRQSVLTVREQRPVTRRRITLAGIADQQWDHRNDTLELQDRIAEASVFNAMHLRLDELGQRITRQLRAGYAQNDLTRSQNEIATTLDIMADALDQPAPPPPDENADNSPAGQGGQGQPQQPPLVPDLAELQLLRGVQAQLLAQTRALEEQAGTQPTAEQRDAIQTLAIRQRELAHYGQQMLRKQQDRNNQP